jgi:PAT family beta-lactamase induction signal transducer AmpG
VVPKLLALLSLALGSWLLNQYGFLPAILMLSIAICLIMLVPLFLRERPEKNYCPDYRHSVARNKEMQLESWAVILKSLYNVFSLPNSLLLATVIFIGLDPIIILLRYSPFLRCRLGWTDLTYSQHFAVASLIGGIGGMLFGGILIDRFGKMRMLNFYIFLQIVLTSGLAFFKIYWINAWFINSYMIIYQVLYVFTSIGLFAAGMQCCWKKVSASQFTLYMTIGNLGRIVGAKLIGPLKDYLSWEFAVFSFPIMIALAWVLIQFIHINKHVKQVNELENRDAESRHS